MAAVVIPIAKSIDFCEKLLPDATRSKHTVVGIFNAVRQPEGEAFPSTLDRLSVFAQLSGEVGDVPTDSTLFVQQPTR